MYLAEKMMKARGMSQAELSRRTGLHPANVNHILRGKSAPYPRALRAFAYALDYEGDPAELFAEVEDTEGVE